ncbi:MFS transporter superfamily protein [Pleurotus pulmonarius]
MDTVTEGILHRRAPSMGDDPEKSSEKGTSEKIEINPVEVDYADEALRLVGTERAQSFSEEYNRKLRRKLDWHIMPLCAAVYFTQYLDKNSLNYASIMGLPITGQSYNLVSMAFYLGFLVWEFPTVYIAQKMRMAKYLGMNTVAWGAVLMLHSVGTSFGAFFALRFLLGMLESCNEQATRISWFYVMNGVTHIFGGFVSYGISFYSGNILAPYQIVYIVLGGLAIVVGISILIWLPDSPIHARMLTAEERIAALERVRDDQGGTENKTIKRDQVIEALLDIRTWLIVLTVMLTSVPNGGISNFSSIIIRNFGYTSRQALILGTPGGAMHACMVIFCGWYSDKKNERMMPIVFALLPAILGSALLIAFNGTDQKGVLLFGIYIATCFGSALSTIYAYNASNTSGHTKKNTINALTMVTFALGNIIGTEIFPPKDAPDYIPGKIAVMTLIVIQLGLSFIIRWINLRLNKQKRAKIAELKERYGWTEADVEKERERHAFLDLTDKQNPFFVYTA